MTVRTMIKGFVLGLLMISASWAQGPGGRGGGGGGRMMMGPLGLLRMEEVQKELTLSEDQLKQVDELAESMRGAGGPGGGPGGPGGGNFQDLSEEEREKMMAQRRQEAIERAAKQREALVKVLNEAQLTRLDELVVQSSGADALSLPQVSEKLKLSDEQKTQIASLQRDASREMREVMRAAFSDQGGDGNREQMQAKMTELRKAALDKVVAVLSAEQQEQFTAMKGKLIDLPVGRFGGPGGRRNRDGGGARPPRPE